MNQLNVLIPISFSCISSVRTRESLNFSTQRLCSRHAIDYLYLLSGLMAYVYVWSSRCTSICSELDRAECLQQHQQKHRDFMEWKKSELFLRWEERSVEQNG